MLMPNLEGIVQPVMPLPGARRLWRTAAWAVIHPLKTPENFTPESWLKDR